MDREEALFSARSREENAKTVLLSLQLKQTQLAELISNALEHAARACEVKKELEERNNLQEERMRAIESERISEKKRTENQIRKQNAETQQWIRQLSQWENSKCLWVEEKRLLEQRVETEVKIRKELEKKMLEIQDQRNETNVLEWKGSAKEFQLKEKKIIQTISCTQQRMQSLQGYMEKVNAKLCAYSQQMETMKQDRAGSANRYEAVDEEGVGPDLRILQLQEEKELRQRLQEQYDTTRVENDILKTRNDELERVTSILQQSLQSSLERSKIQEKLLQDYESSSSEGTKVISMLQDALDEAVESSNQAEKKADAMVREVEQRHQAEKEEMTNAINTHKSRIAQLEYESEKSFHEKLLERLTNEKNVTKRGGNEMEVPNDRKPTDRRAPPETSRSNWQPQHINLAESNESLHLSGEQQKKKTDTNRPDDDISHACICAACREEAFGFMVKCHKCKDPFHARCIKLVPSKKRSIVTFTCTKCRPPLRPEKMRKS